MKVSGREPQAESQSSVSEQGHPAPSRPGYTAEGLPSAQTMREAHQEWADAQIVVSYCAFCDDWKFEGPAGEARDLAKAHREKKHPEACVRKPRRQRRITKKSIRTAGEEEQIKVDAAEANRVRTEREQNEMLAKIEKGRIRDRAAQAALDGTAA